MICLARKATVIKIKVEKILESHITRKQTALFQPGMQKVQITSTCLNAYNTPSPWPCITKISSHQACTYSLSSGHQTLTRCPTRLWPFFLISDPWDNSQKISNQNEKKNKNSVINKI
jgi:hypothetical protein